MQLVNLLHTEVQTDEASESSYFVIEGKIYWIVSNPFLNCSSNMYILHNDFAFETE